jgi:hypothetical protein
MQTNKLEDKKKTKFDHFIYKTQNNIKKTVK